MREIRNELSEDRLGNREWADPPRTPEVRAFYGDTVGLRLVRRAAGDPHLCVELLGCDDGHWFPLAGTISTYWALELARVVAAGVEWCEKNAGADIASGRQYGWKERV